MSLTGLPFDDIRDLVKQFPEADQQAKALAQSRSDDLSALTSGNAHQAGLNAWLASYSGKSPNVARPMLALFAGTHKVNERLSTASDGKTLEAVTRLAAGGAPANQVCAANDIGLKVFDLALQYPIEDITEAEALDEKGAAATIGFGMEAIAGGVDVLGLAGFGQGSEVANAALISILQNIAPETVCQSMPSFDGGVDAYQQLVRQCIEHHASATNDPLELLRRIGGREHSALAGAILAARINHVPVVLDSWTGLCVALLLQRLDPASCNHCCFASALIEDDPIAQSINASGLTAVLSGFGLSDDGSVAAMAIGALRSVAAIHSGTVIDTDSN